MVERQRARQQAARPQKGALRRCGTTRGHEGEELERFGRRQFVEKGRDGISSLFAPSLSHLSQKWGFRRPTECNGTAVSVVTRQSLRAIMS